MLNLKYSLLLLLSMPAMAEDKSASFFDLGLSQSVIALVVFFVIISLLGWGLRRLRLPMVKNNKQLQIIQQISVGPKERVMIIEAQGQRLVIGVTTHSIRLLDKIDLSLENDSDVSYQKVEANLNAITERLSASNTDAGSKFSS